MRHRLVTLGLLACLTAALAEAQTPQPSAEVDGFVHVELTLAGQEISVAYPPDLSADDGAHQLLLSGTVGARVRVGYLEAHRALRIGSRSPGLSPPTLPESDTDADDDDGAEEHASTRGDELWLVRDSEGWKFEAHTGDGDDVSIIPLTHRATETESATFTASVHATAAEAGRLKLRWGRHAWSTDFRFDELPPTPRRPRVSGRGRARQPDTDTTALSRRTAISERNETALVFPDGSRIAVLYWKGIDIEDEDYGRLSTTADGAVVQLIRAAPLRLKTDVSLRFGQTEVPAGNLAPGFAGAYAVWLRKAGNAWRLAFNDEPDSWGTQHDPSFDRAEVDADYERGHGSFRPLAVTLVPTSAESGQLVVHWGPHEWTADFAIDR